MTMERVEIQGQKMEIQPALEVLREKGGRIRWNIAGNTPEQNEQLGIRNVQALFLQRFPEFNNFPRDEEGKIIETQKAQAKGFIAEHIDTQRKLLLAIGGSVINPASAPYFEGLHLVVLQKSFSIWGVEFEDKDLPRSTKKKRLFLSTLSRSELIERIESEALLISNEGIKLVGRNLAAEGRLDLVAAIRRYYPGKWFGLKTKLGLGKVKHSNNFWQDQQIEEGAREFYEQEGRLSYELLNSKGKSDLGAAINKKYPGGLRSLKEKLGIEVKKKPNGYWTKERIEQAAQEFYRQHRDIYYQLLKNNKNYALSIAIQKFYPGGMNELRNALNLPNGKLDIVSDEEANAQLRRLVEQ